MSAFPVRRILVPVDFSRLSRAAWRWARALAAPGAKIEILYVHEAPPAPILGLPAPFLRAAERKRIAKRLGAAYPGAKVRVEEGGVVSVVLRRARSADLVVMGCHGRRGLDLVLTGSVTEAVVHGSSVPVLAVKSGVRPVKSVLAPVNLMPYSRRGLGLGAELAAFFGAQLAVMHVSRDPRRGPNSRFFLNGMLSRLPGDLRRAVRPRLLERGGGAVPAILTEARRHGIVVLTAHRKSLLSDIVVGTTAERVLRYAKTPVLTAPSGRSMLLI